MLEDLAVYVVLSPIIISVAGGLLFWAARTRRQGRPAGTPPRLS